MSLDINQKIQKANFSAINEDYQTAIQLYTEILAEREDFDITLCKVIALLNINDIDNALKECDNSIFIDRKRYEGYFRRGICHFRRNNFKPALVDFEESLEKLGTKNNTTKRQIEVWINKCKAELQNKNFNTLDPSTVLPTASTQHVQQQQAVTQKPKEEQKPSVQTQQGQPKQIISSTGKIAYSWYQTVNTVGIEINFSLSDKNQLKTKFDVKQIDIGFPIDKDRNYDLQLTLLNEIVPENTKVDIQLNKVVIIMEKKDKSIGWKKLEADEGEEQEAQQSTETQQKEKILVNEQQPSYPTSSKNKKNWDKLDQEIEIEAVKNKEEEGDALNGLFKQIYSNADEQTRKAMIKSFQTSGGTVLSTNWDEVKGKDYEGKDKPSPPKGQEWKQWEK